MDDDTSTDDTGTLPELFRALCARPRPDAPSRAPSLCSAARAKANDFGDDRGRLLAEATRLVTQVVGCVTRWKALAHRYLRVASGFAVPADITELPAWYAEMVSESNSLPAATTDQIDKDLHRTWYTELAEEGHGALSRLLCAAAVAHPRVGYCQGMNFIGAVCLHVYPDDEPAALIVMLCILKKVAVDYFSPGLIGALQDVAAAQTLINVYLPDLGQAFNTFDAEITSWCATDMIMCLFVHKIPLNELLLLWDMPRAQRSKKQPHSVWCRPILFLNSQVHAPRSRCSGSESNESTAMQCYIHHGRAAALPRRLVEQCDAQTLVHETLRMASMIDQQHVVAVRARHRCNPRRG